MPGLEPYLFNYLIYLTITRSNMAFAVGVVSHYMHEPNKTKLESNVMNHQAC